MLNATRYSASAKENVMMAEHIISVAIIASGCLILFLWNFGLKKFHNDVGRVNMLIEKRIFILGAFHLLNALNDVSIESFHVKQFG